MIITDFLVVGSGIGGMSTALKLSQLGSVILLSKKNLISGSTPYAQGGISAVRKNHTEQDSIKAHYEDTIAAGGHHNDLAAVELLVGRADDTLDFLEANGVRFDASLHLEGGHRFSRIWHVADHTGASIARSLRDAVRSSDTITVVENAFVSDLLVRGQTVHGVECVHENETKRIFAKRTVLASGGAGQVYARTTNPPEATGDGIALAVRAGAEKKDLEFVQFHPTALLAKHSPLFLLSEALRGVGARIVNAQGISVGDDLATRDEVARQIVRAQRDSGAYLDLSMHEASFWQTRFPEISHMLSEENLLPGRDFIPVTPAAHFLNGGITSDLKGRSTLHHLSVVGEVACTGVHGANRLASNSLLEGVVFALQIADDFTAQAEKNRLETPDCDALYHTTPFVSETSSDANIRQEIQRICWDHLGIIRSGPNLTKAIDELSALQPTGTETKNVLAVATFIAEAAKARTHSLGSHFLADEGAI